MRKPLVVLIAFAGIALVAHALEGMNGAVATRLFGASDALAGMVYPTGFTGVPWDDPSITAFEFGQQDKLEFLAAGPDGDLFVAVIGRTDQAPRYKGLIQWDGALFLHLVQDTADQAKIYTVTVSPVSAGKLTAGHPVIVREVFPAGGGAAAWELWSIDPTTSPATETLVHGTSSVVKQALVDAAGDIFLVLSLPGGGAVVKLTFNGTDYDETVLAGGGLYPGHVALGGDGALYGLAQGPLWGVPGKGTNDILRVDPDTGTLTVHARVSRKFGGFFALAADSVGRLWIGLQGDQDDIVTEVRADETIGTGASPIASSPFRSHTRAMVAGPAGELYITHWSSYLADAETEVYRLEPGEGGGDSGGGGKGKGKNK